MAISPFENALVRIGPRPTSAPTAEAAGAEKTELRHSP